MATDVEQGFFVEENEMHSLQTLNISGIEIGIDEDGRFSLNDLHRSSGGAKKDAPSYWMANQQFKELVAELCQENTGIPVVTTA